MILAVAITASVGVQAGNDKSDTLRVALPWQTSKSYWESATGTRSVNLENAAKSPVYDLRNKLTGIVPGLEIKEDTGSILPSDNWGTTVVGANSLSLASHGFSSLVVIVDDVLVPFNDYQFDLNQIESISLLNEATAKAKYGPRASYGALYITTRKGGYNTPMKVSADFRSGVDFVDNMVEWANGYEYAVLNNVAREQAGLYTRFDDEALNGFARGDMFNRKYPSVDYRSLVLKDWKTSNNVSFDMQGGSSTVKYNFSLNGLNNTDIYNVGPASDYNKLNVSSSISAKIGKWIEANVSFYGLTAFRRGNNGSLYSFRGIPATSFPVALGISTNESDLEGISAGNVIYAVSKDNTSNPYAAIVDGGFYTTRYRSADFNATIDFDMSWLLSGLKSKTFINTNNFYYQKVGKSNDYIAYYWDPETDINEISSHVGTKQASKSSQGTYTYQSLSMYERLYWDWARGYNKLNLGATYFLQDTNHSGASYYERQSYFTGNIDYSYAGKYIAEVVLQYAGSSCFSPENRFDFFPAASFAWLASEEDFIKNVSWIDRLKVHAGAGSIADADVFGTKYLYRALYTNESGSSFGPATAYQWFGVDKRTSYPTTLSRLANPNLKWPHIFQVDAGVDFEFCNCMSLSFDWFRIKRNDLLVDTAANYPDLLGLSGVTFYDNFNENLINGFDLALQFTKTFGDFRVSAGGNVSHWRNTRTQVANDLYLYDWQKVTGREANDYVGYVCLGKFNSEEEIEGSALYNPETMVGDLKYKDLNNDGKIDANDQMVIGNTAPKLRYAVNIDLAWKNFSLFVVGTGRAFYQQALTNEYFWNGWGDGNYSAFVRDNIGGEYPRLSYDKSASNFLKSDFWLRDSGYFKIQTVELAYTLPFRADSIVKNVKFSVRGANLFTFTKFPYVDPESMNAGVSEYPLFRSVAAGIKLNF